jgi:hypothetical protein
MASSTENKNAADEWLVVTLGDEIAFEYRTIGAMDTISVAGTEVINIGNVNFLGFYDWLIGVNGDFVGIQFYPFSLMQIMPAFVPPMYVKVDDDTSLSIFFREAKDFDPRSSVVQCFSGTRCFKAASGLYSLGFGLAELSDGQKKRLLSQVSASVP